jgi:hypothetical protein
MIKKAKRNKIAKIFKKWINEKIYHKKLKNLSWLLEFIIYLIAFFAI